MTRLTISILKQCFFFFFTMSLLDERVEKCFIENVSLLRTLSEPCVCSPLRDLCVLVFSLTETPTGLSVLQKLQGLKADRQDLSVLRPTQQCTSIHHGDGEYLYIAAG